MPAASPASTIETKSRLKTFGWLAIASDSSSPLSTSSRSCAITSASAESLVCCSRIVSAETTFMPASIIVANWREKIWSDFGLTVLNRPAPSRSSACAATSVMLLGEQAA